ncbi:MAG: hypothetical protein F4X76_01490 [Chloroflexi bacterium]|nr:hypothetical protein [Chloroflexota bacterium]
MCEQDSGPEPGGCRETLLLTRIAFGVLIPPLLAVGAVLVLLIAGFVLFTTHPLLGLLPLIPIAAGLVWLARRERDEDRDLDDFDLPR